MCLFHKYESVDKDNNICGQCFVMPDRMGIESRIRHPEGFCPHLVRICIKCGNFKGWGSHGKLSVIPDNCKRQVKYMIRMEVR